MKALGPRLYHSGFRRPVPRSTLADANEKRKMHTLLTLQGNFPVLVIITTGKVHDVNILDDLVFEAGAFYIMDRGYVDFARLHRIHRSSAFFVTRAKKNFQFRGRYSAPVDKTIGIRCDQTVVLTGVNTSSHYPDVLRRIVYVDPDTGKRLVFLSNNMSEPAITIAQLYRCRWQVELFFNRISYSPYTILQILSITLFEKTPILQALSEHLIDEQKDDQQKQLVFQGF